jgi:hypothetical protein
MSDANIGAKPHAEAQVILNEMAAVAAAPARDGNGCPLCHCGALANYGPEGGPKLRCAKHVLRDLGDVYVDGVGLKARLRMIMRHCMGSDLAKNRVGDKDGYPIRLILKMIEAADEFVTNERAEVLCAICEEGLVPHGPKHTLTFDRLNNALCHSHPNQTLQMACDGCNTPIKHGDQKWPRAQRENFLKVTAGSMVQSQEKRRERGRHMPELSRAQARGVLLRVYDESVNNSDEVHCIKCARVLIFNDTEKGIRNGFMEFAGDPIRASPDRIDNTKGYILDNGKANFVFVCTACNGSEKEHTNAGTYARENSIPIAKEYLQSVLEKLRTEKITAKTREEEFQGRLKRAQDACGGEIHKASYDGVRARLSRDAFLDFFVKNAIPGPAKWWSGRSSDMFPRDPDAPDTLAHKSYRAECLRIINGWKGGKGLWKPLLAVPRVQGNQARPRKRSHEGIEVDDEG